MRSTLFLATLFATSLLTQAAEKVYAACGSVGIRVSEFDSTTGTLGPFTEAISLPGVGFMALHPEKPFLYATCPGEGKKGRNGAVGAFRILEDGTLDVVNLSPTKSGGATHLSLDATAKVAFAASYGSGSVTSFAVKEDGSLSPPVSVVEHEGSSVHPTRQKGSHAHYFAAGPQNKFAYAPDLGLDQVVIYRFDPDTAELTPAGAGQLAPGAGPRHMKFSQDGKFAYVLNELNITVTTFRYDAEDGSLEEVATISAVPEGTDKEQLSCAEIVVHPSGKFLYTSQRDLRTRGEGSPLARNSLSLFRISREGTIQRTQTISAGVRIPRNFNVHPGGQWLLAGGQLSDDVQVFAINPENGRLSPQGEPVACPGRPQCFLFR